MKKIRNPIPEGLRIKLNGEQEWKDVMQVFEDAGWMWRNGRNPTDTVKKYAEDNLRVVITVDNKTLLRDNKYQPDVLTATEFLNQYQGTIEYEPGDWVMIKNSQMNSLGEGKKFPTTGPYEVNKISENKRFIRKLGDKQCTLAIERFRPATPEEIPYDTKVASKDPDVYIWDGDVLTDEYWVENPWPGKDETEFVQLFNSMKEDNNIGGASRWYHVKDSEFQESHDYKIPHTDLPIVPYKLWKSILEQPDPLAEPVAIKPRYHIDNVMDQNIAISCPTIELWNAVTGLIPNNNRLTEENWKDYNSNDEIAGCNINQFGGNHCDIDWYKDEKYTIITAEEFLRDNGVAVPQPKWSIVTTDGVRVYEGDKVWWYRIQNNTLGFGKSGEIHMCNTGIGSVWLVFSTFEAGEKYRQEQLGSSSTVKENIVPIGWKPGDSWRHKDGTCGLSISVHPKDGDPNMYFIDYAENATAWVEVNVINEFVAKGLWIINPDQKSKQEEKSQTIINKQSKTKQNEKGNSISITEQCIVINSNYINCKTSNATYVPGDEERITKGQRRQGSTVRG